ncbi:MAG: AbrB/MazE/SpoVT family DNA-binding domain-containing protein [Cuniculiplasma sp.]|jgi:AbrB family looped-hinge helix DNA binding protein
MIELGKITSKGQITIPKEIRDALGVSSGDKILFEKRNGDIVIKKAQKNDVVSFLDQTQPLGKKAEKILKGIRGEWD